ncbi:Soluble lytic murein transglycosylase precursor [hydrothermal vent metagenome]|uniref:Soluble lytic murein transglycosylase n=1 Tax=hydrothermal vent metagenome TaxID=652676 RepID=A0A1W1EHI0_9ZZZZ
MRYIFLFFILFSSTYSKSFSFDYVDKMPLSREKDYYIWRFLSQSTTTKSQAIKIVKGAKRLNSKLKKAYFKKIGKYPKLSKPKPKKATKAQKEAWKRKVAKSKKIKTSLNPIEALLKEEADMQTFIFNSASKKERKKFNHILTPKQYQKLTRSKAFNKSIKIIKKEKLNYIAKSFLFAPALKNALNFSTLFELGLNAIKHNKSDIAILYFGEARKKAYRANLKDQATFWLYLLTREKLYLKSLINSEDINIYTLLARDKAHLHYPQDTINPKLIKKRVKGFDITNPIDWAKLKEKIFDESVNQKRLALKYASIETVGHYAYIQSHRSNYKRDYFPMPYRNILKKLPKKRQALIYAIARQESRFIPASISTSFALGMMQIMPFLVKDIAKKKGEKIDLDEMFNPYKALEYANIHLDYLTSWLYNPLLVAYAYNGGIGFTRNILTKNRLFQNKNYEPFMSMESISVEETREYGKNVLTNYVIYLNKLGVNIRISKLLKEMKIAKNVDNFR